MPLVWPDCLKVLWALQGWPGVLQQLGRPPPVLRPVLGTLGLAGSSLGPRPHLALCGIPMDLPRAFVRLSC